MKKFATITLALAMMMSLAACGDKAEATTAESTTAAATTEAATEEATTASATEADSTEEATEETAAAGSVSFDNAFSAIVPYGGIMQIEL